MKITCSDGVTIGDDMPRLPEFFVTIRNYMEDFPDAETMPVPYPAARIRTLYASLVGPDRLEHDDDLEDYLGLETHTQKYLWSAHKGWLCDARKQILRDNYRPTQTAAGKALAAGCLVCVKYLHANGFQWTELDTECAAANGRDDCLMFLHYHGCPWDESCTYAAAKNGHYLCLVHAHRCGCPWDYTLPTVCVRNVSFLRYVHENGCPWNGLTAVAAVDEGSRDSLEYYCEHVDPNQPNKLPIKCAHLAAARGEIETLEYLREHGLEPDQLCAALAAFNDHWECTKHLCKTRLLDAETTALAVKYRELDCLKFLHEGGVPWDSRCFAEARGLGDARFMEYLCKNGCPRE